MKLAVRLAPILLLLAVACSSGQRDLGYDPAADNDALLAAGMKEAAQDGRQVLLVAGGDWCRWCHVLGRFLDDNPDVHAELERHFVVVKVYSGDEGTDEDFFARLPEAPGYPHFWIVRRDGSVRSYGTSGLERGDDDYDREKFLRFIREASGS
jgi:hypothetical protein